MKPIHLYIVFWLFAFSFVQGQSTSQTQHLEGWAKNSVNTTIFRNYALYTHENTQFIAYYDQDQNMVLGQRKLGSDTWLLRTTRYKGNARDAHNGISIIVDDEGYLHVSWDHHNTPLRYAVSKAPMSLELGEEQSMVGKNEKVVSYPQFYALGSDILFFYRSGGSGNGDLFINKYDIKSRQWTRLQSNLISGENQRNAYWQACTDAKGTIHISWVWRESPDVASNHDMCYARSEDGGKTWTKSDGTRYQLPITASNAEIAAKIPQGSELINQTSMTTDKQGSPVIATYWRPVGTKVPQYHLVYQSKKGWQVNNLGFRQTPFSLSGMGTKAIPIARPKILVNKRNQVFLIFRDAERDNKVSVASSKLPKCKNWEIQDLTTEGYEHWEPTLDPVMSHKYKRLHLFLQAVTQVDGEGLSDSGPQPIRVLEWAQ